MIKGLFALAVSFIFWVQPIYAAAILDIQPSSTNPIVLSTNGSTYLSYTLRNNSSKSITGITIAPGFGGAGDVLRVTVLNNQCTNKLVLPANASCNFNLSLQGNNQAATTQLMPRICIFNNAVCSVPIGSNRTPINITNNLPSSIFPTPYAGTFYPLYNAGVGQWIVPNTSMPFDKVSAIFAAFAHAYSLGNGAIFTFELGQVDQPGRLALLVQVARSVNPGIKVLISLGWGKNDWDYINRDYVNHANLFVPSVIEFIRANHLDGVDIDDEDIGETSGSIPQNNFDGVIANLRNALNNASLSDGKPYYLTISPAGNNSQPGGIEDTEVSAVNMNSFDLINIQTYYNGNPDWAENFFNALVANGYPRTKIANGIDTEQCNPDFPPFIGLAGLFNWNMSSDSACSNFQYTNEIASLVGYPTLSFWRDRKKYH